MITPYNFFENNFLYRFINEKNTLRIYCKDSKEYIDFLFQTDISFFSERAEFIHLFYIVYKDDSKTFTLNISNHEDSHFKNYSFTDCTITVSKMDSLFDNKYFNFYIDLFLTIKDIFLYLNKHNQNLFFTFDFLSNAFENDLTIKNRLLSLWSQNSDPLLEEYFVKTNGHSLHVNKYKSSIVFTFNNDSELQFCVKHDFLSFNNKDDSSQVYSYEVFLLILHHCNTFFNSFLKNNDFIVVDEDSFFNFDKFSILEREKTSILSKGWLNYPKKIKL